MMFSNTQPTKSLYFHLKSGLYCGIFVGLILAYLESIFLLFHIGNFYVDMSFFVKATLLYVVTVGLSGSLFSAVLHTVFLKRKDWPRVKIRSFYFSIFLGIGVFFEIFMYLMDIIPYGGPNKYSMKTLSLIVTGAIVSIIIIIIINYFLKKISTKDFFKTSLQKKKFQTILVLIVLGFSFLTFIFLQKINLVLEKKAISSGREVPHKSYPNVIIILVDAMRPDHLSCYGYSLPTTPHIDALAAQGVLFKSVLATSSWSVPTHASLFTGLYPSSHGACSMFSVLEDNVFTLSEILSKNGYYSISLYNNPFLGKSYGLDKGFDSALGIENDHKASLTLTRAFQKFIKNDSLADDIIKFAHKWIDHCFRLNRPYFIFVNILDVHAPYSPKEPYFSDFLKSMKTDQVNLPLVKKFGKTILSKKEQLNLLSRFNEMDFSYLSRMYDSNIRHVDEQVGKLIKILKRRKQLSNTLIIVTADHGEYLGEHGIVGHPTYELYNPGLKIPLILYYPKKLKSKIEEKYVSQIDIPPTILSLLGFKNQIPSRMQGADILSIKEPRDILAEFWNGKKNNFSRTIISQGMKLIVNIDRKLEMYDLRSDPEENNNLASLDLQKSNEMYEKLESLIGPSKHFKPKINEKKKKELRELLKSLGYIGN